MPTRWSPRIAGLLALALAAAACSGGGSSEGGGTDGSADSSAGADEPVLSFSHEPSDVSDGFSVVAWSDEQFDGASTMEFLPDGRALVGQKGGWQGPGRAAITVLSADGATLGVALEVPVCTDAERGLIGLAVDPQFGENGFVYVAYTRQEAGCAVTEVTEPPVPERVHNRVSRFTMAGNAIDPASEVVVLDDLIGYQSAHNGGALAFLPDGTLLVGTGEANQEEGARSVDSPAGKVLRVDPRTIGTAPADNPFVEGDGSTAAPRNVVYATGLRNPFRIAVNPDGLVVAADVGTDVYEELNVIEPGHDYGFPAVEGPADEGGVTPPVFWYTHGGGCSSVIGGEFLDEGMFGRTQDTFVFGDFGCRTVWFAELEDGAVITVEQVATVDFAPSDFAISPDGRLFVVPVGEGPYNIAEIVG